jgi:hypothetical protein
MYEAKFGSVKQTADKDDKNGKEKGGEIGGVAADEDVSFNQQQMDWSMRLLEEMAAASSSQAENLSLTTALKDTKKRSLFDLVYEYKEYYTRKEYTRVEDETRGNKTYTQQLLEMESIVFCVSECPVMMPYQTEDKFCTDDKIQK